jgi:peptide/nickel transport system substrate-binding protein
MRSLTLRLAAALLVVAFALAGCTPANDVRAEDDASLSPIGERVDGGTVTFATVRPPDYVFPMSTWQYWGAPNRVMLWNNMYRPLYWFGTGNEAKLDEDLSLAEPPVFSDGNTTVTIELKPWKFSNGEQITARNVEFWINMVRAVKATYPGYVAGQFPDNVASVESDGDSTVILHLTRAYSSKWFLYNQLSQITPLPMAWDRTSLDEAEPSASDAGLPDETIDGAREVWAFLDAQSADMSSWATSPLWQIVSGPFRVGTSTSVGEPVSLVPNENYSGSMTPSIDELTFLTFTSDTAEFTAAQSSGIDYGFVPLTSAKSIAGLQSKYNVAAPHMFSFGFLNLNQNHAEFGPLFSQLYFRQAMQHLINQKGWIESFLEGYGASTLGPVPEAAYETAELYPYSTKDAAALLSDNGWKVEPGGASTCINPGSGAGQCGDGIPAGFAISFSIITGNTSAFQAPQMADLQSSASEAGIQITAEPKPPAYWNNVVFPCTAEQAGCEWEANATPVSWDYGLSYYPTGEVMFRSDAPFNATNYADPKMDELIDATLYAADPAADDAALAAYADYAAEQLPMNWFPLLAGNPFAGGPVLVSKHLGGVEFNVYGSITPEFWFRTE